MSFIKECLKSPHQKEVEAMMRKAGQRVPDTVDFGMTPEERLLRAKLHLEEAMETITALGCTVRVTKNDEGVMSIEAVHGLRDSYNPIAVIDGCLDSNVIATGTLSAMGVPDSPFVKEVDANNLAKFGPGGWRRPDGKWMKPPGHPPPDITGILKAIVDGEKA